MTLRARFVVSGALLALAGLAGAQPGPGFGGFGPGGGAGFPPGGILRRMPLMSALDADGNGELSAEEISAAPAAIAGEDADGSGEIEGFELLSGLPFAGPPAGGAGPAGPPIGGPPGDGFGGMLRMLPMVSALDRDGSGVLSGDEIAVASESLNTLDADGDGRLIAEELLPPMMIAVQRMSMPGGAPAGPLTEPEDVDPADGLASIESHEVFERLSYQGAEVLIDTHLTDLEYVKFILAGPASDEPRTYFMDTNVYRAHMMFAARINLPFGNAMSNEGSEMFGVLIYRPELSAPNGQRGLYTFEFEPNNIFDFELIQAAYDRLVEKAPILADRLAYHPLPAAVPLYRQQQGLYETARLPVLLDEELYADVSFLPLNIAEGYGRLRVMDLSERPNARDVVIYRSLPNELPRVAGIITAVPQTPLSHVNLRAVQDRIPNAYIASASDVAEIAALVGRFVYYRVGETGYEIREATDSEVERHFADLRPATVQIPERDLSVTGIRPLSAIGFGDSVSVGVKAANVAVLGQLGLPPGVAPEGFAIPFYFYDEFMKFNGFYRRAMEMQASPGFVADPDRREAALAEFREAIESADMPAWMLEALAEMHAAFPAGTRVRLRSSTNNEDLPGFSGAGLYDSVTHRPAEGHISKSVKQIFASLWNYRAYEEREFYRVDHLLAAMGVLAHPNYSDEAANGVAVSDDIVFQDTPPGSAERYYVNVQLGEDLVTNPDELSIPEDLLLSASASGSDRVLATSNRTGGELILSPAHRDELRRYLGLIHDRFRELYGAGSAAPFAIEVEFKITSAGELAIKQARPWVY